MELVGPAEVAAMLNVSRQRVGQLAARSDFPVPVAVLQMGKVWLAEDIRVWAKRDGRL
jgi:predicted DNA-binding transcriptional regulator AlpA